MLESNDASLLKLDHKRSVLCRTDGLALEGDVLCKHVISVSVSSSRFKARSRPWVKEHGGSVALPFETYTRHCGSQSTLFPFISRVTFLSSGTSRSPRERKQDILSISATFRIRSRPSAALVRRNYPHAAFLNIGDHWFVRAWERNSLAKRRSAFFGSWRSSLSLSLSLRRLTAISIGPTLRQEGERGTCAAKWRHQPEERASNCQTLLRLLAAVRMSICRFERGEKMGYTRWEELITGRGGAMKSARKSFLIVHVNITYIFCVDIIGRQRTIT